MSDAIDFGSIAIFAGPDVHAWPVTSTVTRVIFLPANWQIESSKQWDPNRWPDAIPPGWEGPIQYTLWPVVKVDGQWRTCPAIEFWYGGPYPNHGRYDGVGGPYSKAAQDWYFHVPQMAGHQPMVGETVGFFTTTAVQRNSTSAVPGAPHERSNVVICQVPASDSGTIDFSGDVPPQPEPEPPPDDGAIADNTDALRVNTAALDANTAALERVLQTNGAPSPTAPATWERIAAAVALLERAVARLEARLDADDNEQAAGV